MEQVRQYKAIAQDWLYQRYIRPHVDKEAIEQERLAVDHQQALTLTGLTLDQLKTELHVVTERLDRKLYRGDEQQRLLERQDKLMFMIKKMGRSK